MSIYVGGLRARLIHQSTYEHIKAALTQLGWFDSVPSRQQVSFPFGPAELDQEIALNTAAITDAGTRDNDIELGSTLGEIRWTMYVDFFGENRTVAVHFIQDVRDILRGRMASVGAAYPAVDVYDYDLATPAKIFSVDIEDVVVDHTQTAIKPWMRNWYMCRFDIVDYYTNEEG